MKKDKIETIIAWVLFGIVVVGVLSLLALNIYTVVAYRNTPTEEIPFWVFYLTMKGN